MKTKRLVCFLTIIMIALQAMMIDTAAAAGDEALSFEVITDSDRNVFAYADDAIFIGRYKNKSGTSLDVSITAEILDNSGNSVWSETSQLVVKANTTLNKPITPENVNSGLYTLKYKLTYGTNLIEGSEKFYVRGGEGTDPNFGVCSHFAFANPTVTQEDVLLAKAAGASFIRDECWWGDVETKKGVYSIPERVSKIVDFAYNNGIEVLMPLTYGNALYCDRMTGGSYEGGLMMPHTDAQIAAYAAYCGYLARTFKGKVNYFEIWNEADSEHFNYDIRNTGNGATYAKLLKAAYTAIKSENPNAVVVGFGARSAADSIWYIQAAFDAIAAEGESPASYIDAVSVHPYTWTEAPSDETDDDFVYEISAVRNLLDSYNMQNTPIWVTEVGYIASGSDSGVKWTRSPEQQAAYNAREYIISKADGRVDKFFFYELQDNSANVMGMMSSSGELKPQYYAYSALNERLRDTRYSDKRVYKNSEFKGYSAYRFTGKDKDVFVMWANGGNTYDVSFEKTGDFSVQTSGDRQLTLNLSGDNADKIITVYDAYGNINQGNILLDWAPVYIVCEKKSSLGYVPQINISFKNGEVTVSGIAENEGELISVKAETLDGAITYANQTVSKASGEYSFTFTIPKEEECKIYLYDGLQIHSQSNADVVLTLYKNGVETSTLSNLKAGDEITVKADMKTYQPGMLIAALYNSDMQLIKTVDVDRISDDNGSGKAETSLVLGSDNDEVRIIIFDNIMKPLARKIESVRE